MPHLNEITKEELANDILARLSSVDIYELQLKGNFSEDAIQRAIEFYNLDDHPLTRYETPKKVLSDVFRIVLQRLL